MGTAVAISNYFPAVYQKPQVEIAGRRLAMTTNRWLLLIVLALGILGFGFAYWYCLRRHCSFVGAFRLSWRSIYFRVACRC